MHPLLGLVALAMNTLSAAGDPRNITTGWAIPAENYCDQPYVVVLADGTWVCCLTTGRGVEGEPGQHVVSTRSRDCGRTWEPLVDIEPADGPEASWVMPLLLPSGRIYAFYVYNSENRRTVKTVDGKEIKRVDSFGELACKWSDDGGRSWSKQRVIIPIREFQCDRDNVYGGAVKFFWGVGKPIVDRGVAYMGLAKVHGFGPGFFVGNEGIFLRSDNVLTEPDPSKVVWETLPDGEIGLKSPGGPIASEHNLVALSDGSLYCTYRTIDGHPCHAYSRDGGHTWTPPAYMTYTPGGRLVKHPRAANFVKRAANGKYLYWFHNHGGKWYDDRNPVWVCGGVEKDGYLHWSQPEILLYDDDPAVRMSYPDFLEADGRYFFTETQKTIARVHEIDPTLLEDLWRQGETAEVARRGLLLTVAGPGEVELPRLPNLKGGGLTLDLLLQPADLSDGQTFLDNRDASGKGFRVCLDEGAARLVLNDGRTENAWRCDRGLLTAGRPHHVTFIVDGGPRLISVLVDGVLNDGGTERQFGWGRFSPHLREVNGGRLRVGPAVRGVRVYGRYLRVSEAVANWRAGW